MDEGERGDDEDDAGRCRSDARARPSTAFVVAERVGGTVARAGVDIAREREKKFRERPLLYLPETEGAIRYLVSPARCGCACGPSFFLTIVHMITIAIHVNSHVGRRATSRRV